MQTTAPTDSHPTAQVQTLLHRIEKRLPLRVLTEADWAQWLGKRGFATIGERHHIDSINIRVRSSGRSIITSCPQSSDSIRHPFLRAVSTDVLPMPGCQPVAWT